MTDDELKQHLVEKEIALTTFGVRRNPDALTGLLSEEFREIGSRGNYFGLDAVLAHLPTQENWQCELTDIEARKVTDDVMMLVYFAEISSSDAPDGYRSRRSSVWRKEGESWKMVFHQGTELQRNEI